MRQRSFDPGFLPLTPNSELNYIGAVEKYFDRINGKWADGTQDDYVYEYNTKIFPLISQSKPMDDYDEDDLETLIEKIRDIYGLSESTIQSRIRHLVYDPYDLYCDTDGLGKIRPAWGSAHHFQYGEDEESALLTLKKSLSRTEQARLRCLLSDPSADTAALAVMAYSGLRNNEVCGLNYGDIVRLKRYGMVSCLRIFTTTERNSSSLKLGGKTRNSPRLLPLIEPLAEYLEARRAFVSAAATLPLRSRDGIEYSSLDDLPIACRGSSYQERCRSNDLSTAGRAFLRDTMKLSEQRVSGMGVLMKESDVAEAEPTTYLLRRNFATKLKLCGFTDLECHYYMGHELESELYRRSDFMDEDYLYEMWLRLRSFPV